MTGSYDGNPSCGGEIGLIVKINLQRQKLHGKRNE